MKFVIPLSLERRTLTAIAATLWSTQDFLRSNCNGKTCSQCGKYANFERWKRVQKEVERQAHELPIPENLRRDLLRFVGAVGYEISRWCVFHIRICKIVEKFPTTFVWTAHGTIDRCSTAKLLVCDPTVNVLDRFKLACIYCIEECIFMLWDQLDSESRSRMKSERWASDVDFLVKYWCSYVEKIPWGKHIQEPNPHQRRHKNFSCDELTQSLHFGNIAATELFFTEVTEGNKTLFLSNINRFLQPIDTRLCVSQPRFFRQYTHVLCFVLNQLDETLQVEIVNKWPRAALCLCLEWPWQRYFMKLYECIGCFLSDEQVYGILKRLLVKQVLGFKDYDYKELFVQLWRQISVEHKQFIFNSNWRLASMLRYLSKCEDLRVLIMVINDATYEQKMKLLSDLNICRSVKEIMMKGDWNSFECFVTECLLSEQEIMVFKNSMHDLFPAEISTAEFTQMNIRFNTPQMDKQSTEYSRHEHKKPRLE